MCVLLLRAVQNLYVTCKSEDGLCAVQFVLFHLFDE